MDIWTDFVIFHRYSMPQVEPNDLWQVCVIILLIAFFKIVLLNEKSEPFFRKYSDKYSKFFEKFDKYL